jgi:hypothetical protein
VAVVLLPLVVAVGVVVAFVTVSEPAVVDVEFDVTVESSELASVAVFE